MFSSDSKRWITKLWPILILLLVLVTVVWAWPNPTIISDPVCAPPCWNNIQPGATTQQEAYRIISELPEVDMDTVKFRGEPRGIFTDIIYFELKPRDISGEIHIVDGQVVAISFSGKSGITISDAFAYLGEPTYIINIPTYGGPPLWGSVSSEIIIINPTVSYCLFYNTRDLSWRLQGQIRPETELSLIIFLDPAFYDEWMDAGLFSLRTLDGEQTREHLIPWDGYGDLAIKYPQVEIDHP